MTIDHIDLSDDGISNPSDNPWLSDIVTSRRTVVLGGVAAAFAALAGASSVAAAGRTAPDGGTGSSRPRIGFTAIPAGTRADTVTVPEGYTWHVLAPWGDPIVPSGPAFAPGAANTAAAQAAQMGMHHDGMHFFPLCPRSSRRDHLGSRARQRGLLVMNHEYVDQTLLFGYPRTAPFPNLTGEQLAIALAAHGVSVIEIEQTDNGSWAVVESIVARRITGDTPVRFSGPVSDTHPMLATGAAPRGTLNNCAHGSLRGAPTSPARRTSTATSAPPPRSPRPRCRPGTASAPAASGTAGTPLPPAASTSRPPRTRPTASGGWWRSTRSTMRPSR